ncbi:MAG: ABC transporter substrate-binding protein [Woeseiaceae bacterium]|nr:ABC transporter substrate-binding protein [Woeseiaceae bacterium]NIP19794.1 ABC transporter substrate-binding protein [Woeseiaceae bacterium]NIS89911.1 ABC transporter substrate-binding protein [Woeseiaceae bacterium]
MRKLILLLPLFSFGCGGESVETAGDAPRGVTDDTIVIGSHNDLSGVLAIWGVPSSNGQRMRFDDVNSAGGIHGRTIEFIVEDTQYQMPMAVKATNKLLNVDDIFLMVGAMGTPMNIALMPKMFEVDVPSLFPLTGAVQMYEPLHPMKFSYFVSYRDQVRGGMRYMVEKQNINKVCLQAIANDYGEENLHGYEQAVEELGLESVYVGRHKNTETDFVGTITAIKNSGCEMLVLGPLVKDTILIYAAARDAGWNAPIISNMVSYVAEVASAANGSTEGLYTASSFYVPDFKAAEPGSWLANWYEEYVSRFGEEPAPQSIVGYTSADLVVRALEAAGRDLTVEKVLAALESIDYYEDPFGGPSMSFSATKHQGGDYLRFYQVRDGKWEIVESTIPY